MRITMAFLLSAAAVPTLMAAAIDRETAVKLAIETASRELNVPAATMKVRSVEAVEWRDSGLGCAPKGTASRPQLIQGFSVTLTSGADRASVHVGDGRAIVCSHTASAKVSSGPLALAAAKAIELARADLASRLNVAPREISVDRARPTTWPDESLGCPEPGKSYAERVVPGFTIDLAHAKTRYRYHSDMSTRVVRCDQSPPR